MYATCLHCHGALGANVEVEAFPVGGRLAFDAQRGRLWVICPRCARWNLSPLEERWEAVEWCERAYRDTTTRSATREIGLAVRPSGLELVRIGAPLRPEFAAWRYGRALGERHRRAWQLRAERWLAVTPEARGAIGFAASFIGIGAPIWLAGAAAVRAKRAVDRRRRVRGIIADGMELPLVRGDVARVRLRDDDATGVRLQLPHAGGTGNITGAAALDALGRLLVHVNDTGGSAAQVQLAVAKIEHFGSADSLVRFLASKSAERGNGDMPLTTALHYEQRLALEMVAHESTEQRAMDGELAALEAAWRGAEEIAAIADDLLTPAAVLRRLRGGGVA